MDYVKKMSNFNYTFLLWISLFDSHIFSKEGIV